ncbi:YndM family protein [Sporosarcina sp. Marseille-Q4063]|uniref:YndM family protein n=1 Tax=Sporosarcina sp. Marseille-Q4063 TaxID=2810514 RepID=UPI001BB0B998|nr:YndM family protein [Sporosarcina sp. Marseille-Q4063]QUW21070.1 YndM family protein [Sporosarcina sp. Marseille-Q4063]
MNSIRALIIKFIMITAVLWIVFGLFGFTFGDILVSSVLLTGVSYIVGDRIILPRFGNVGATIADVGLAFVMLWFLGSFLFEPLAGLGTASFISAAIIGVGEFMFHRYLEREVLDDDVMVDKEFDSFRHSMQTEFGSEEDFKRNESDMREEEKAWLEREKDDYYSD